MMIRKTAAAALLLVPLIAGMVPANGSTGSPPPGFGAALGVAGILGGLPPGVTLREVPGASNRYAAAYVSPNVITVYPAAFTDYLTRHGIDVDLSSSFGAGMLAVTLMHEKRHICLNSQVDPETGRNFTPDISGGDSCRRKDMSCEHLAIDASAAKEACAKAEELKECMEDDEEGSGDPPPPADPECTEMMETILLTTSGDAEDTIEGICAGIAAMQEKWNTEKGRDKAESCCDGTDPCPFPHPGGGGYPPNGPQPNPPECNVSLPEGGSDDGSGEPGCNFDDGEHKPIDDCDACDCD